MFETLTKNFFSKWIIWYFRDGPKKLLSIWNNFLRFNLHFFSISILFKTLFAPWKKIQESYTEGLANLSENFSKFILNVFSRMVGAFVRSLTIIIGIIAHIFLIILGPIVFILWFLLPWVILSGLAISFLFIL